MVPYRKADRPYCPEHGLRLHRNTFVYFNGLGKEDGRRARLRNFIVEQDTVATHVLDSPKKAETHRLGYEMSEDAISWNVFVALLLAGKLGETAGHLTGRAMDGEPDLYLWGCRVERGGAGFRELPALREVRRLLEPNIRRFPTEPDIMLVIPGRLVICIEAKFGSGNVLASSAYTASGEKPKSVEGLVDRYLDTATGWAGESKCIKREGLTEKLHSQLFRNVVFAARMAESQGQADWHVVNLVSSTRWKGRTSANGCDYQDPTASVQSYLSGEYRDHFTFRTWEGLYSRVVRSDPGLPDLQEYMLGKSAHFRKAFVLE